MRFEYWMGQNRKWHLYAVAENGRVVSDEGLDYDCVKNVLDAIDAIKMKVINATVINLTENKNEACTGNIKRY
jgi:hypothetical protein